MVLGVSLSQKRNTSRQADYVSMSGNPFTREQVQTHIDQEELHGLAGSCLEKNSTDGTVKLSESVHFSQSPLKTWFGLEQPCCCLLAACCPINVHSAENVPRVWSNPWRCGQRAQALPTELFRPVYIFDFWQQTSAIFLSILTGMGLEFKTSFYMLSHWDRSCWLSFLSFEPSHVILTPCQPVLVLTLPRKVCGRVAIRVPTFNS